MLLQCPLSPSPLQKLLASQRKSAHMALGGSPTHMLHCRAALLDVAFSHLAEKYMSCSSWTPKNTFFLLVADICVLPIETMRFSSHWQSQLSGKPEFVFREARILLLYCLPRKVHALCSAALPSHV